MTDLESSEIFRLYFVSFKMTVLKIKFRQDLIKKKKSKIKKNFVKQHFFILQNAKIQPLINLHKQNNSFTIFTKTSLLILPHRKN